MQFLNPWLLFGLIAIMIPIAVHLFNFRRYRKIYFSNVQFLKDLKQQTRKQSNLLHRLVLACRILAFLFIVLAFAQPFFFKSNGPAKTRSNIISVYVDNSFSMETQGTRGSLLEEARDMASEIASAYKQDDLFQLITNDFEGKHQQLVSRDEFIAMLNDIEVTAQVRSLKEVSARQSEAVHSNRNKNIAVHYISDFQRSTVLKSLPDTSIGTGFLIPLKPVSANNIFIDSCWFSNPVLQLNEQTTLFVRISNVSDIKLEKIPVRLMIDKAQRAVASVDIDPGSSQELSFTFSNNKAGDISGYIEVNDFPVTYDDVYYFTFQISSEIPVLCINYNNEPDPYIKSVYSIDSIVTLTNTNIRQVDYSSLPSYRLVILNGLETYTSGLTQEISVFVKNGGNILIIPSFESNITDQNNFLSRLGTDVFSGIDSTPVKLAKINTNHPLYKDVFEEGSLKQQNLDLPLINSHFSISGSSSNFSETLLELTNGQPLMTINKAGKGKVYLFASALNDESGNFVRHALFVPTMLNIAFQSGEIKPLMYHTDYSNAINVAGNYSHGDNIIKLSKETSNYEFIPELKQVNGETQIFINNQVTEAGIYQILHDKELIGLIAFNYDRDESDLKTATEEELERIKESTGYEIIASTPKPLDKIIKEDQNDKNLWKWFVIAALLSLIAETLLLSYFKRRTAV